MAQSLFHRKDQSKPEPQTPYDLIEAEIVHLKKGTSVRYGNKPRKMSLWLVVLGALGLGWLYLMDPCLHAWYKYEAIKAYVYLHNYGAGPEASELAACGILDPSEVSLLNERHGSFQDYYDSPTAAADNAKTIISYTGSVKQLHAGKYADLDPIGRMRYLLFIRTGLVLPTSWNFLDPNVTP